MTERKRYDLSDATWAGIEAAVASSARDLAHHVDRLYVDPEFSRRFFTPRLPPTRWERVRWRACNVARRPFEWLRDRLVAWLGCDCDPDW